MKKFALIIGNSEYKDGRLSKLTKPSQDARDLAKVLEAKSIAAFDRVDRLINKPVQEIRIAIERFCLEMKRDDLMLLYFSGHGVKDSEGQLYFAAKDTDSAYLGSTGISSGFVVQQLNRSHSRRQILILDCCYSGAWGRSSKGEIGGTVGTQDFVNESGYGRVVLTATDAVQFAWEDGQSPGDSDQAVFTHYLIEGLKEGKADTNGKGYITLDDWYEFVHDRVVNLKGSKQTPRKFVDNQVGELVISQGLRRSPALAVPTFEKPKLIPATKPKVLGIDVSEWYDVDWTRLDRAFVRFVLMRATQGSKIVDPRFSKNWEAAKTMGIIRGAYHCFRADQNAAAQATHFVQHLKLEIGDLPPTLDLEPILEKARRGGKTTFLEKHVNKSDLVRQVHTWLQLVQQMTGRKPIIYTNSNYWNAHMTDEFGDYPLWVANYETPSPALLPKGWTTWTFWQYSDQGPIVGLDTPVDTTLFNGSFDELQAFVRC